MPLVKRTSITSIVKHNIDYYKVNNFVILKSQDLFLQSHNHLFESEGASSSILEDRMEYSLSLGILGKVISQTIVKRKLKEMFD